MNRGLACHEKMTKLPSFLWGNCPLGKVNWARLTVNWASQWEHFHMNFLFVGKCPKLFLRWTLTEGQWCGILCPWLQNQRMTANASDSSLSPRWVCCWIDLDCICTHNCSTLITSASATSFRSSNHGIHLEAFMINDGLAMLKLKSSGFHNDGSSCWQLDSSPQANLLWQLLTNDPVVLQIEVGWTNCSNGLILDWHWQRLHGSAMVFQPPLTTHMRVNSAPQIWLQHTPADQLIRLITSFEGLVPLFPALSLLLGLQSSQCFLIGICIVGLPLLKEHQINGSTIDPIGFDAKFCPSYIDHVLTFGLDLVCTKVTFHGHSCTMTKPKKWERKEVMSQQRLEVKAIWIVTHNSATDGTGNVICNCPLTSRQKPTALSLIKEPRATLTLSTAQRISWKETAWPSLCTESNLLGSAKTLWTYLWLRNWWLLQSGWPKWQLSVFAFVVSLRIYVHVWIAQWESLLQWLIQMTPGDGRGKLSGLTLVD